MEQIEFYWNEAVQFVLKQDEQVLIVSAAVLVFCSAILLLSVWGWRRKKLAVRREMLRKEAVKPQTDAVTEQASQPNKKPAESWIARLHSGLTKTRSHFSESIGSLLQGRSTFDEQTQEELHETLFRADLGVATADSLMDHLRKSFDKNSLPSWPELRSELVKKTQEIFDRNAAPINEPSSGPLVILVVGVNGVGKTTSIGKLAAQYMNQGKSVLMCAADTYRAAAIEQLETWAQRTGCDIVKHKAGADPASVAYDGVKAAIARNIDVLLIDTAGRLHSKKELMDELAKIKRVIGKDLEGAPHETWLAIDATTGQNAFQQVQAFSEVAQLSGLVVTKLDGTAKGGVVIGVSERFSLPIRYIGVGEKAEDLRPFQPKEFAESVF